MSHCHSEHGHSHGGDGGDGGGHHHDHDDHGEPSNTGNIEPQNLLHSQIDFSAVNTLNESDPRSGAAILQKTWALRLEPEPMLKSDADEQLLMTIPFTGQVRLQSILIRTSASQSAPRTLKVFINRDDVDFATATDLSPTQTFTLAQTNDIQEYPVKRALFNMTRSLNLFFEDNYGDGDEDETTVCYLAFKGEFTSLSKEPVTVLYEAAANPADHKNTVKANLGGSHSLGF